MAESVGGHYGIGLVSSFDSDCRDSSLLKAQLLPTIIDLLMGFNAKPLLKHIICTRDCFRFGSAREWHIFEARKLG